MNNEAYIAKGKLAELQQQYDQIEMRADAMLIQIRELLNPTNEFLNFDIDLVLMLVKDFRDLQLKARDVLDKIKTIKSTYNL